MANRRSSPQTVNPPAASSPPLARKKYPLRQSPPARKRGPTARLASSASHAAPSRASVSSPEPRPVLVPVQFNLRRLPSRGTLGPKATGNMRISSTSESEARTGAKRKRVAASNENAVSGGARTTRGSGRAKRLKADSGRRMDYASDDSDASSMDIDSWNRVNDDEDLDSAEDDDDVNNGSDDDDNDEEDEDQSSDDYLINSAQPNQLLRLRKDDLVRLYERAGLCDDTEHFTKSDIVDAIINARDDMASLPPSSPPGHGGSSDYSSDDGHLDEPELVNTRFPPARKMLIGSLRRRATTNDFEPTRPGKMKGRSLSASTLHPDSQTAPSTKKSNGKQDSTRRRTSSRASPVASTSASAVLRSPPATRTRSRKTSAEVIDISISTPISNSRKTVKGKGKQVEFDDQTLPTTPSRRTKVKAISTLDEESDLTELDELEEMMSRPSPRRLRSKDRSAEEEDERRITPMRKAKGRILSLKESDTDEAMEEDDGSDEEDADEVDELVSNESASPRVQRTPIRRRLRSGQREQESASDGDDEEEEDEEEQVEGTDDEATIAVEPRRLRNGKIVGEDDDEEEDEEMEVIQEEEAEEDEGVSVDIDAEGDTETEEEVDEETIEDEPVDLAVATAKTLVRLRRDDLVNLCEARELDASGTKSQLAAALLEWRDQRETSSRSSRSSTGTVRPPSTVRRARRRLRNSNDPSTPPLLLRSDHVMPTDDPNTPAGAPEPEVELDLGDLGLDDREIAPDKLQKLEKIGSGGFKDVFIGKYKGRKIAISEFRGQLSSMDIKELKLLGGFDHPNIVRFIGVSVPEKEPVMFVSELCSNGDLFDYIRNTNPPTLRKMLMIMLDIARGVEYLHNRKPSVIHRDCKSSNILITSRGSAKIADFGLAKVKQSTRSMMVSLVGTVNWQAPELWHAKPKYNGKVDVFSCGMVYWEMMQWHAGTKRFPWEGMNEHAIYEVVGAKRQRPSVTGLKKLWCPEVVALVERMWAHEHEQRPSISEVVTDLEALVKRYS